MSDTHSRDNDAPLAMAMRADSRDPGSDFPRDQTLHDLVLEAAVRRPDALAVELDGGGRLTYAELDERTRLLAERLRSEGIGPGALVGVLLERSLDLAVALIGVMRSGAAYVP